MAIANHLAVDRWTQYVESGKWPTNASGTRALSMEGHSIFADGDTIYSYGRHFPMATAIRNKNGSVRLILVNGDTYSSTTSQHQGSVRAAVSRMGYPSVIVPFSALDAASIVRDTIELVEVRPDRHEQIPRVSDERPGAHKKMVDPEGRTVLVSRSASGIHDTVEDRFYESPGGYGNDIGQWREWPADAKEPTDAIVLDERPVPDQPSVLSEREAWEAWRERYRDYAHREVPHRKPLMVDNPNESEVGRRHWLTATRDESGMWHWTEHRHWLGDSCFRAKVREAIVHEEWGPAVQSGSEAWDLGYSTLRSGQHPEHGTSPYPHGGWAYNERTEWKQRSAYFLSSFDYQEARPLYFLCELPRGKRPTSVEHAYQLLRPAPVLFADEAGLEVTRQGDVFAVPTSLTTKEIKSRLKRGEYVTKRRHVLGTEHSCTEVAICKGGEVYGRGVMYHDVGGFRERDHARRKMLDGKTWHLLVRNTVPRA